MPLRGQFIYIYIYILNVLWLLCISTMIFVTDTFDFDNQILQLLKNDKPLTSGYYVITYKQQLR